MYTTDREYVVDSFWKKIYIFLPSIFWTGVIWFTNLVADKTPDSLQYYFNSWRTGRGELWGIFNAWTYINIIIVLIILITYYFKSKHQLKKKQTLIYIFALFSAHITMFIFVIFIPLLFGKNVVPIGLNISFTMFVIIAYGVIKYDLFKVNPATILANIMKSMTEGVFVLNPKYVIEYTNEAASTLLNLPNTNITGNDFIETIGKTKRSNITKALTKVANQKTQIAQSIEHTITANGENIPVRLSITPYRENNILQGFIIVITDMRKIQELLNISAERNKLQVIQESVIDGLMIVDWNNCISMVNTSATRLLSMSREDLIGKPLKDVFLGIRQGVNSISIESLLPHKKLNRDETIQTINDASVEIPNGQTVNIDLISSVIKEGHEVDLQSIITLHDLSAEKDLEKMKLDFVAMAAHELRTPLTTMKGYLSVYREQYEDKNNLDEGLLLGRVESATKQLIVLMENLLSASRIEQGKYNINVEPTNWITLISEQIELLKGQAADRNIELKWIPPTSPFPLVEVDRLRITEVLNNLISNGLKYTHDGYVEIMIEHDTKNNKVITAIKDTGQGIPANAIPHMFKKFFRVSGNLEMGSKGTGLGLYISKSVITLHHGDIWVESAGVGKGSTFKFSLPVSKL